MRRSLRTHLLWAVCSLSLVGFPGCIACFTKRALPAAKQIEAASRSSPGFFALGRFPIRMLEVQLAADEHRCAATILGDGRASPVGSILALVPGERFTDALNDGEHYIAGYEGDGVIISAVVLADDEHGHVFVTREPDGSWSRHRASTFESHGSSVVGHVLGVVACGSVVGIAVVGDVIVNVSVVGLIVATIVFGGQAWWD